MTARTRHSDSARRRRTRKTRTGCGQLKPLTDFHRKAASPDGHDTRCKPCRRAARTDWCRYNRRAFNARARRKRQEDPEADRARSRKWRDRNGETARRSVRRYHAAHAEELRAYKARYRCENRHKIRAHSMVRQGLTFGDLFRPPCEVCSFLARASNRRKTVAGNLPAGPWSVVPMYFGT